MKRFAKLLSAMLGLSLMMWSCESETVYEWDEESRINEYVTWIDNHICRQMVDQLDFLFQASAYRDSLLVGGDTDVVLRRQFSNPHFKPVTFNEQGEIATYQCVMDEVEIVHNGISLDQDGAVWKAYGRMDRFWTEGIHQQPTTEYCQFTVSRENGHYTLSGGMIHNGLFQEFFTMSNFNNIHFTTSIAEVQIWVDSANNIYETKQTLRYCFDGEMMAVAAGKIDYDHQPRPDAYLTLNGLTGHNSKEYIDGIPVFGTPYFNAGRTVATLSNGMNNTIWKIAIDYSKGDYYYSKIEE
ncbi:MAG: hypothetical protein J6R74_06715 [Tidjanibacter sp.]|nr:hypothetical protein [Tidjanibacter sp.]